MIDTTTTTDSSIADLSLAEYRAARSGTPAATQPAVTEDPVPDAGGDAGDDAEAGAADENTEHSKPAKRGGYQRKIEKLSEENKRLSEQLASRNAAQPEAKVKETPAEVVEFPAKPKLEDFDGIESYTEALTDWKAEERERKSQQAKAELTAKTEHAAAIERWTQRQAEAKKQHPDYDDVLASVDDVKLTPAHQKILIDSEAGAEIAYQLAQDPAELRKFARLDPLAAAKFLGRLEAAYESPEPTTTTTSAPRPIRPISGRSATSGGTFNVTTASLADYRKARESGRLR